MKNSFIFLLPVLCFFLFSCQKEVTDPDLQPQPGSGGTGTTTGGNYMPLTKNNVWKFRDSTSGMLTTMTALDKTVVLNGRTFTTVVGKNTIQTDTFQMTRQGADYFNYARVDNGTSSGTFLFHYLNDTASVGKSWEYLAGEGNGIPAYFKTTILRRDFTHSVQGKTYANVIHTRMELSYDIMGNRLPAATYEYYCAKDIGIIQVKSKIDMFGIVLVASSDLMEYQVR